MKKILNTIAFLTFGASISFGQGSWISLANFFEGRQSPIVFSLNNKIYTGLGRTLSALKNDLWAYNPTTDAWTQRADFPGNPRIYASSVEFNNKGYVMCGYPGSGQNNAYKDFWEYNPSLNSWSQKVEMTGLPSYGSLDGTAFATSSAIYYLASQNFALQKKLWKYDPALDYWIPQTDYPGMAGQGYSSFVINGKPYVGTGEFYEFEPVSNTWIPKANIPSATPNFISFAIGSFGYVGVGGNASSMFFFRYNPQNDTWTQETSMPATARGYSIASVSNLKAYVGLGSSTSTGIYLSDFWEFTPSLINKTVEDKFEINCNFYPNPTTNIFWAENNENLKKFETLSVFTQSGVEVKRFDLNAFIGAFDISELPNGVYYLMAENSKELVYAGKIVLSK